MTRGCFGEMTGAPDIAAHIEAQAERLFGLHQGEAAEAIMTQKIHHVVQDASSAAALLSLRPCGAGGWLAAMSPANCRPIPTPRRRSSGTGIEAQSELCFENLRRILRHAGYSMADVVFVRIYLRGVRPGFRILQRRLRPQHPQDRPLPSRTTVGVSTLGRGALVEIDMVCFNDARR